MRELILKRMKTSWFFWGLLALICMLSMGGSGTVPVYAADKVPAAVQLTSVKSEVYNKVVVRWKSVAAATQYRIYYKKKGMSGWTKVAVVDASKTGYTHVSSTKYPLEPGQVYTYTVRAYNKVSDKCGKYDQTGLSARVPIKPQLVELERVFVSKSGAVTVSWKAAKNATQYFIYYKQAGVSTWKKIAAVGANTLSYSHKSTASAPLKAKQTYVYTVRGYNEKTDGRGSYDSKGISVKMPASSLPAGITVKPGNEGLMSGNQWNNPVGVKGRTLATAMHYDGKVYGKWLQSHMKNSYYVGTPFRGACAAPNGDYLSAQSYPGMNCTAFVWHVLWKAMQNSGNYQTPASYGFGTSRAVTYSGWAYGATRLNVERGYYKTKEDLFKIGKPRKGDIIWFMCYGDGVPADGYADNHALIYMGDGTTDLAWHSSVGNLWCDGTYDGVPGGHWISAKNSNGFTEIAGPQNVQFGYILIRAGGIFD